MNDPNWGDVRRHFERLRDLSEAERHAELERLEAEAPDLGSEVRGLLETHDGGGSLAIGNDDEPFPDFEIIEELGSGAMGVVYLARQLSLGRRVAIKVLRKDLGVSTEMASDFIGEARRTSQLNHPSIVKIHSVGASTDRPWFVMEYVEGPTLKEAIEAAKRRRPAVDETSWRREGGAEPPWDSPLLNVDPDPFRAVALTVARIAEALQHFHDVGVVHRDIKPSNILLDPSGRPKVADFGIAKELSGDTRGSLVVGTPYYISPEQARLQLLDVDGRSDVYSLGVVLYELLSLTRPFEGENHAQVFELIAACRPSDVGAVNRTVPRDLAVICHKAMRKLPEQRYQSAAEFAGDLRRFLDGTAPLAGPPTLFERGVDLVRGAPLRTAAALAVLLAVAAAIGALQFGPGPKPPCAIERGLLPGAWALGFQRFDLNTESMIDEEPSSYRGRAHVEPGSYRMWVEEAPGRFAEIDLDLTRDDKLTTVARPTMVDVDTLAAEMVEVPAGRFDPRAGVEPDGGYWPGPTEVPAFLIDRYEVTNGQYRGFLAAHPEVERPRFWPPEEDWQAAWDQLPVAGVSRTDAMAFATWVGKRLPTATEWAYAARGTTGREFLAPLEGQATSVDWAGTKNLERTGPWTDLAPASAPEAEQLAAEWQRYLFLVRPVGQFPRDRTPSGVFDLHGNVTEWTRTPFFDVARSEPGALVPSATQGVTKGSHFEHDLEPLWVRHPRDLSSEHRSVGFRCAKSLLNP